MGRAVTQKVSIYNQVRPDGCATYIFLARLDNFGCYCLLRPLEGAFRVVLSRISIGSFFRRRLGRAGASHRARVIFVARAVAVGLHSR